ncbi:Protein OS-9 [Allomyces arbusculus]|nr:Protein OS-9 [Allomyces arbusculus]
MARPPRLTNARGPLPRAVLYAVAVLALSHAVTTGVASSSSSNKDRTAGPRVAVDPPSPFDDLLPGDRAHDIVFHRVPIPMPTDDEARKHVYALPGSGRALYCPPPTTAGAIPAPASSPSSTAAHASHRPEPRTDAELITAARTLLAPLRGTCQSTSQGWWSYQFCYQRNAVQFHDFGAHAPSVHYVLGRSPPSGDAPPAQVPRLAGRRYLAETYTLGTICDVTGHPRTAQIQYHCAVDGTDRIAYVKELATCAYVVAIHSPRLCADRAFADAPDARPVTRTCTPVVAIGEPIVHAVQDLASARVFHPRTVAVPSPTPPLDVVADQILAAAAPPLLVRKGGIAAALTDAVAKLAAEYLHVQGGLLKDAIAQLANERIDVADKAGEEREVFAMNAVPGHENQVAVKIGNMELILETDRDGNRVVKSANKVAAGKSAVAAAAPLVDRAEADEDEDDDDEPSEPLEPEFDPFQGVLV